MKTLIRILPFAGTIIAFFIGSGFATAQEILQYFAAYGRGFILVAIVSMGIFFYTNWSFIRAGESGALDQPGGIYGYYCGKYIGKFYEVFSTVFIFLSFVVMCGGAGAAVSQQFGTPYWTGAVVLGVLAVISVALGLDGLVNILGKLGPVIIASILLIGFATMIRDFGRIGEGFRLISSGEVSVMHVGTNFFTSAVSYAGFVMLWFCKFMAELSAKNEPKDVRRGMYLGTGMLFLALAVVSLALIANIADVAAADIPSITLASMISPALAAAFAVITLCGIYTTGVPLLWTTVSAFAKDGTAQARILAAVFGVAGVVIALFLPYRRLINIIYGINGYVGVALIFFMLAKDLLPEQIRGRMRV